MFVSALETAMEGAGDPRASTLALFTSATDIDFHEGRSDDPLVHAIVSHPAVRGMMGALEGIAPWPERRLVTLGRGAIYNLIKVLENGRARDLERGLGMVLNRDVRINVSIPNTLSPDLMVDDPSLNPAYRPALLYDYSPLVKALEDAMYVTATVQTSVDISPAIAGRTIEGLLASTARGDADTFRDVVSAAVLDYLALVAGPGEERFAAKAMQRRSSAVFGAAGRALRAAGMDAELIPEGEPWYGREVYAASRLLVFLRALIEVPDDTPTEGTYVPSYRCIPGPGLTEVRRAVSLTKGMERLVAEAVEGFAAEQRKAFS